MVSAIVEKVVKKPFPQYMKSFFHDMGLKNTYLDENKPLIYNRAKLVWNLCQRQLFKSILKIDWYIYFSRYYVRNEKGRLENAPLVDNSYKWAGGGFLSTVKVYLFIHYFLDLILI